MSPQRGQSARQYKRDNVSGRKQMYQHAAQLEVVNRISFAISNLQGFESILNLIFEQVRSIIKLDVFYIALYEPATGSVSFPLFYEGGKFWQEKARDIHVTTGVSSVVATRRPVFKNRSLDEIEQARISTNRLGDTEQVTASFMIIPLIAGEVVIGALSVQSYSINAFDAEKLELLNGIANQVAVAIQNARLLEEVKQFAGHLEILNKLSTMVAKLQDLPELLELIYQQVNIYLSVDAFFVDLYDLKTDMVSHPITYDSGIRYHAAPEKLQEDNFLKRFLQGESATLELRTLSDLELPADTQRMFGNKARKSASIMAAPIRIMEQVIGAISVQSYKLNVYTEQDLRLLVGIGNQVGIAIHNSSMLTETRKNTAYLATLNELGRIISELRDFSNLLEVIYHEVRKHLKVDVFFVGLNHPETNMVTYPLLYDENVKYQVEPDVVTSHSFMHTLLHGGQATRLLRTQEEVNLISTDKGMLGNTIKRSASLMYAPLKVGERVIGVISVQSYTLNAYSEGDLDLLIGVGNQVGVAVHNARLVEEIKQNSRRLEILNELSRAIAELKSLPELFDVVYLQAKKGIPLDTFYVGLYKPESNEISFPIMYDEGRHYDWESGPVSENSFLARFLRGEKAILLNRTPEEISNRALENAKVVGNAKRLSASFVVAPLLIGGNVIGIISAQSYTPNIYKESDLDLLIEIANRIAIAIQNSRLYTSAQQELSERQKIEQQLRIAETQYRELVESVPAVIYSSESGEHGRWFFVSPQIEGLLGYKPEEWLSDPDLWFSLIHPDDQETIIMTENQAMEAGQSIVMEYRMSRKDGRWIWVRDESRWVGKSERRAHLVQGTLTDITARKQAELTLKESEERYHALFLTAERQARDLALLADVQSAITRELELREMLHVVVEVTAQAFGYTYVSLYLLEDGLLRLQHQVGYDAQHIIEVISPHEGVSGRVLRSGQPILIADVLNDPDFLRADKDVHSEISVPLFNGDEIAGVFSVESPIAYPLTRDDLGLLVLLGEQINIGLRRAQLYTERAESLRREQRLNEFVHAINSVLELGDILKIVARLNVELVGAESGTVSLMSDDGLRMTNVYTYNDDASADEILPRGEGLTWFVYETNSSIVLDEYLEHFNAMPEWSASGLHAFMAVPIGIGDMRLGVLAVYNRNPAKKFSARDLSLMEAVAQEVAIAIQNARLYSDLQKELEERKRIESEREAMYKDLETKNAELERFTYTVSHDLKSPLVTIGGFIGFIEEDIKHGDLDRIVRSTQRIREAANKMRQLLDELLELSRIGRLANPSSDVEFSKLAREAVELVQGELTAKRVEVRIETGMPVVFVDRIRMVEVLQNLISNAIKFMGQQPQPLIEIGQRIAGDQKAFFVCDNGIGIAPEFHERIFGLFNKLDQFSEGTGIGLALVKRIVEVHGGKIWVESELGKGATFFFTLADKNLQETK